VRLELEVSVEARRSLGVAGLGAFEVLGVSGGSELGDLGSSGGVTLRAAMPRER